MKFAAAWREQVEPFSHQQRTAHGMSSVFQPIGKLRGFEWNRFSNRLENWKAIDVDFTWNRRGQVVNRPQLRKMIDESFDKLRMYGLRSAQEIKQNIEQNLTKIILTRKGLELARLKLQEMRRNAEEMRRTRACSLEPSRNLKTKIIKNGRMWGLRSTTFSCLPRLSVPESKLSHDFPRHPRCCTNTQPSQREKR